MASIATCAVFLFAKVWWSWYGLDAFPFVRVPLRVSLCVHWTALMTRWMACFTFFLVD